MKRRYYLSLDRLLPLIVYMLLVLTILLMRFFLPWDEYTVLISATLMLLMPLIMNGRVVDLKWSLRGVLMGLCVSAVILFAYFIVFACYAMFAEKSVSIRQLSYSFILMQLLLIALPEEIFFRGYLQRKIGNNVRGVIIVSFLFALAHLVTLCIGGDRSLSVCIQAALTFFPSLVMGYLYVVSGTLWASVLFHFFANIVHIALILS